MKGMVQIPLGLFVASISIFFLALVPTLLINSYITKGVYQEYMITDTQLTLLTLLSSTQNKETLMQIIGEQIQSKSKPDINTINEKLKIIGKKCYRLSYSSGNIVESFCKPSAYSAAEKIVLPYKPEKLIEEIKLVIE